MLIRLAYLAVANGLAMLRLLPMSDRAKDAEILALRHQIIVLERQLHGQRIQLSLHPTFQRNPKTLVDPKCSEPDQPSPVRTTAAIRAAASAGSSCSHGRYETAGYPEEPHQLRHWVVSPSSF